MARIHLVTDSSARFSRATLAQQYPLTILPNRIEAGGRSLREDIDLTNEEMMRLVAGLSKPPLVTPPTVSDFHRAFSQLIPTSDGIIALLPSRELNASWDHAREAAQQLAGGCPITVIDTRTICAGQAILVRVAGQAIMDGKPYESIVTQVRGAIERVYCLYCVETLEYLRQNGIISESRALLGAVLGIKPLVSIEDGRLMVVEKVRTRAQITDYLAEYLMEFEDMDEVVLLQGRPLITDVTKAVQDRLTENFPGRHFPYTMYSVVLASLFGTDATGIALLERETDYLDDGFSEDQDRY